MKVRFLNPHIAQEYMPQSKTERRAIEATAKKQYWLASLLWFVTVIRDPTRAELAYQATSTGRQRLTNAFCNGAADAVCLRRLAAKNAELALPVPPLPEGLFSDFNQHRSKVDTRKHHRREYERLP